MLSLDIETIVDKALLPPDWPEDRFPKPLWHRVVAISYVQARIERDADVGGLRYSVEACRSGGEPGWDEERLLRGFWAHFERHRFQVVTWNGRAFDMQVLLQRAMLHGIATPAWHARGQGRMSYGQRYADWHVDLMDVISGYGASARLGLDETCAALGLPGKPGTSGADVADLVAAGDLGRVRNYCESDALNTYALFLRYGFASGRMGAALHDDAVDDLVGYLAAERKERPHLGSFLDAWRRSGAPSAMYVSNARRGEGRKASPAEPCQSHPGSPFQGVFSAPPIGG
ncbi:3'-5' exonuclease [Methylobacterium sp. D54C]